MHKHRFIALVLLVTFGVGLLLVNRERTSEVARISETRPVGTETAMRPVDELRLTFSSFPQPVAPTNSESEVSKDCQPTKSVIVASESDERRKARALLLASELESSDDADYLMAAALLRQIWETDAPLELLVRAGKIAPRHPLVAWNLFTMCHDQHVANCNPGAVEAHLVEVDGGNGAVWLEIGMRRLAQNDQPAAVEAVKRAIVAPRFDVYFVDHVVLMERALANRADKPYRDRMFEAMGYGAAWTAVSDYGIVQHCNALDTGDGVWLELCDRLGQKMFADGRTILDKLIGLALQKIAASQSGDQDWIEKSITDFEAFRAQVKKVVEEPTMQALLWNDESVLAQYVENFSTYGEFEAQLRLREEAQRLREDPDYDQCNFVSSWLGQ